MLLKPVALTVSATMDYVIGVDIGTQSTKALLVRCARRGSSRSTRSGYQAETPQAAVGRAVAAGLARRGRCACVARMRGRGRRGVAGRPIKALCVSSLYGGSGIPVDDDMQPLHPCLIWMDRRAQRRGRLGARATSTSSGCYDITGNGVDSYYGFTKMLWLREQRAGGLAQHALLPAAERATSTHALTGEVAVDHSSAGNIGGVYDVARRDWSDEMLDVLGIPRR